MRVWLYSSDFSQLYSPQSNPLLLAIPGKVSPESIVEASPGLLLELLLGSI